MTSTPPPATKNFENHSAFLLTCATPADPIRWHLGQAVLARLQAETENVVVLTPEIVGSGRVEFICAAWAYMEEASSGDYLLIADDNMPASRNFAEKGFALLGAHPEFAMISARDRFKPASTADAAEVEEPAGPVFCRKGILGPVLAAHRKEWDRANDRNLTAWLKKASLRVGRARDLVFNDLGYKLGTLWPDDYASGQTQIAE